MTRTTKNTVRILLADDQVIIRMGLRLILESQEAFIPVISEVKNGVEVISMTSKNEYDIIIMDIQMPKMDGISALRKMNYSNISIPVLMMSSCSDESTVKRAIRAGATGYIMKGASQEEIVKAIITVKDNQSYFSNDITQILLGSKKNMNPVVLDQQLTRREWEVLQMIWEEYSNKEMAVNLNISSRTVEGHRKNLIEKLQVKSVVGLAKFAYQNGYIS